MRIMGDGSQRPVFDLAAYEAAHNPAGGAVDSNPFGVHCLGKKKVVATDAGANDLLSIRPGHATLLAVFPPRSSSPPDFVPTSVVVDIDGAYDISQLGGTPLTGGAGNVDRVSQGGGQAQVIMKDFTSVIDVRFDQDVNLLVLEYATG